MPQIDLNASLKAGYSLAEIAEGLARESKVDIKASRAAGYNDWEIIQGLNKPEPGLGELFTRGVKRSVGELGVTAGDVLPALVAGAVLPDEKARPFVERQLKEAAETREELEKKYPTKYKSYKDVEDIGSGAGYVAERVGELVPDIGPSLVTGLVGRYAGKRMAREAADKTANELAQKTELELLEGGTENIAEQTAYKSIADKVGREAAEKLSRDYANRGLNAGVFLGSYAQNAPEIFENIYQETNDIGSAGALLFGGLSSYLDSYLPSKILTDFGAFGKSKIMSEMLKDSGAAPAVWKSVLKEGTKAAAGEGVTEAAQEAISVAAEKFYGSNKDFFGPEAVERYLESFFAGAAGGGVLGGVSGVSRGLQEKSIARGETGVDPASAAEIERVSEAEAQDRLAGLTELTPAQEQEKQQLLLLGYTPEQADAAVKGDKDDTGLKQGATGTSPILLGGSEQDATAGGTTAPADGGVDVSDADIKGPRIGESGVAATLSQIQSDLKEAFDEANNTRAELSQLKTNNVNLLDKEYKDYADPRSILNLIREGKIEVDPAPFEQEAALAEKLATDDERVNLLTDRLTKLGERAGEPGAATLVPGEPVPVTTETGEVVPTAPAERLVIQEDGTYGPAPAEMTGPQYAYTIDKETKKIVKVDKDGKIEPLKSTKETSQALSAADKLYAPLAKKYNTVETGKDKIPGSFKSLPPDLRQAFLRPIAVGFSPETAFKQFMEYRNAFIPLKKGEKESQKFFDSLTKQQKEKQKAFLDEFGDIYNLAPKPFTEVKPTSDRIKREAGELRLTEELSRQRAMREAEVEKSLEQQPTGKGAEVNQSVMDALKKGDINGALEALFQSAEEIEGAPNEIVSQAVSLKPKDKKTSQVSTQFSSMSLVRALAKSLKDLNLQTKIEFNQILDADRYAEYDPATDTLRVSKFYKLKQTTLLHELSHAGTVRVLYLYNTGKVDQLTKEQIRGVQQLYTMMDYAKKRIVLPQYQKAFENIYEFVAYAVTDPRFQYELAKYKSPIVKDRSLWNMVADAIARMFGLNEDQGTLATDIADAFGDILSAPDPDARIDLAALPSTGATAPKTAPQKSIKDIQKGRLERMENQKPGSAMYARNLKKTLTRSGMTEFVRKMQNERAWAKRLQDFLTSTGQLVSEGEGQNNLYTLLSLSAGEAKAIHQKRLYGDLAQAEDILQAISKAEGGTVEEVLSKLHDYAIVLHDPERRRIKYLREAPLIDDNAETKRQKILEEVLNIDRTDPDAAKRQAQKLRADLEALVAANLDTRTEFSKEGHSKYNTLGEYDFDQIQQLRDQFRRDPNKGLIFSYFDKLKKIQDTTVDLNREANYFSNPVNNLVDFYGFKNYFSFKGKPDSQATDYQVDPMSPQVSGELQDQQYAFEGRISESDNPVLNTINEAARAAMRLGRKDVTQAIKNLSKEDKKYNPNGLGKIPGAKVKERITFEDRFKNNYDSGLKRGENTIFHYNPDGSIDIIEIGDPEIRNSIKRPFRDQHPILDLANRVTSTIGQMHTRYNPAFAPVDFTRNLLTYAGIVSAEYGIKAGGDVLKQMSTIIADGGMNKTRKFSLAFANGDARTMEKMIREDKTGFYKDLANYFDKGGRVSYIQGLSYKDNLLDAVKGVKQNGIMQSKEQFDKFFDAWLDMFELTTRVAAYRTIKAQNLAKGMSPESADVEAIAYAKNLANFEQVGEWGKTLGTLFMFFRPAATGAVRAIESIAPAFDFSTDAEIIERAKQMTKFGGATDEQALAYLADFKARRDNARTTALALLGMGATVYVMAAMLSGDDEEERNKTVTDDMARWVRFARFNTGVKVAGQDLVLQMPWGFGNGALASAGAQIMAVAFGGQGMLDALNNIMDATFESFLPLPASKINKFEHPTEWAIDSITPSVLRPLMEFSMNMDGLGRQIYNNRQSRYNDAYTGGDNVPQIFKDAAAFIYDNLGADISPNSLYFFSNNYLDGISRVAATTWGIGNIMVGRKDFDPRTDTFLLDAYIKGPSNYDARQFAKVEDQIKDMERDYKSLEGTDRFSEYLEKNPNDGAVIDFYNSYVNGALRDLREQANIVRRDRSMNPQEKRNTIRLIVEQQNRIKSAFVNAVKGYNVEP